MQKKRVIGSNAAGNPRWLLDRASVLLVVLTPLFGGCETQPVFTAGTGGSDFGTIDDQQGNTYKTTEQPDGSIQVVAEGPAGNLTFTFDSNGKLTSLSLDDGSKINLDHQANGLVRASGVGTFQGKQISFNFTFNPGSSSSKTKKGAAAAGDPFIVCLVIDLFCDSLDELIAELLPPMIDEIISENLPTFIAELGLTDILTIFGIDPADLTFPTGIAQIDDPIRAEARKQIDPYILQAKNYCAHWQLLRLLEISICDAAGS